MPVKPGSAPGHQDIVEYLSSSSRPCKLQEIADALSVPPDQHDALRGRLRGMTDDGVLVRNRRGGYGLAEQMDLVSGRIQAHPDGYGFCIPDDGGVDLFIPPRQMQALMHGDRIVARQTGTDRQGRRQGEVARIVERAHKQVVGRYMERDEVGWVRPADQRLQNVFIPPAGRGAASSGATVVARLDRQPEAGLPPQGSILEIMSGDNQIELARAIIIRSCELPYEWPDDVRRELDKIPDGVSPAASEGREDLTSLPLVTIDGETAKDFDDAVFCEQKEDGTWRLIVAIADVSHYVRPGTALDKEAVRRATSVYFPGYVLPMLPARLSDDLCSLVPHKPRLCFACEMHIDSKGEMLGHRFFRAIMRSAARLTYNKVAAMMEAGDDRPAGNDPMMKPLRALYGLYQSRRLYRQRLGLMEFESTENRIVFGANGRIADILPVPHHDSHHVIEECMLAANQACAQELLKKNKTGIYRTHDTPPADRLLDLRAFLTSMQLTLGGDDKPTIKDYALMMQEAHERNLGRLVSVMVLRSLPLAVYTANNKGHFGLGFDAYTHFTSPIRRYPDLLAHRLLAGADADSMDMRRLAENCSKCERRAEDAERQMTRWCQCDYLYDRIGETFQGIVTGVRPFGLFVELDGIGVDGMVHVTTLPGDYYHFEPDTQTLRGANKGYRYHLSQSVTVKLMRIDMESRRIDMELVRAKQKKRR